VDILGAFSGEGTTLAIDDINFLSCAPPPMFTSGACPVGQFQCKNKVCVSPLVLCDTVNDCGDQSDETQDYCRKNIVNYCNFEPNQVSRAACNWTQEFDSGSNNLWKPETTITASNNMARLTGPTHDHTFRMAHM
jgi:hypothetical protein